MFLVIVNIICLLSIYPLIRLYRKQCADFEKKRKKFVEYLKSKNDLESLKEIGEINMFGQYERWIPGYSQLCEYLEKMFSKTNDINFLYYWDEYRKFIRRFRLYAPILVISIGIPVYSIIVIIQKYLTK